MKQQFAVVSGRGRGRKIGVPTINCEVPNDFALEEGVYAGWVYFANKKYPAAIHFGPRPVFGEKDISLEAYLLEPIEGKVPPSIIPETVSFIRKIRSFPTPAEMVTQIEKDVVMIRDILKINII